MDAEKFSCHVSFLANQTLNITVYRLMNASRSRQAQERNVKSLNERDLLFRSYVNFVWFCCGLVTKGQLSFELATPSLSLSLSQTSPMSKRKMNLNQKTLKEFDIVVVYLDDGWRLLRSENSATQISRKSIPKIYNLSFTCKHELGQKVMKSIPVPSLSVSVCSGFGNSGQLSSEFGIPSPSLRNEDICRN